MDCPKAVCPNPDGGAVVEVLLVALRLTGDDCPPNAENAPLPPAFDGLGLANAANAPPVGVPPNAPPPVVAEPNAPAPGFTNEDWPNALWPNALAGRPRVELLPKADVD